MVESTSFKDFISELLDDEDEFEKTLKDGFNFETNEKGEKVVDTDVVVQGFKKIYTSKYSQEPSQEDLDEFKAFLGGTKDFTQKDGKISMGNIKKATKKFNGDDDDDDK